MPFRAQVQPVLKLGKAFLRIIFLPILGTWFCNTLASPESPESGVQTYFTPLLNNQYCPSACLTRRALNKSNQIDQSQGGRFRATRGAKWTRQNKARSSPKLYIRTWCALRRIVYAIFCTNIRVQYFLLPIDQLTTIVGKRKYCLEIGTGAYDANRQMVFDFSLVIGWKGHPIKLHICTTVPYYKVYDI